VIHSSSIGRGKEVFVAHKTFFLFVAEPAYSIEFANGQTNTAQFAGGITTEDTIC
jgi:hypothetical protein